MLSQFSRITLVNEQRRVDTVVSSDEPLGRLIPQMLSVLNDEVYSPPRERVLTTTTGHVLSPEDTLRTAGIYDGATLRLITIDDIPLAPFVYDVTEELTKDGVEHPWHWSATARRYVVMASVIALFLQAAIFIHLSGNNRGLTVELSLTIVVLGLAGCVIACFLHRDIGITLILLSACLAGLELWIASHTGQWPVQTTWTALAGVFCGLVMLLGISSHRGRGLVPGGLLALGLVAGWSMWTIAGLSRLHVATGMAVVTVAFLGLLPHMALSSSGLASADDRASSGNPVQRRTVMNALASAHETLSFATIGIATSATISGVVLLTSPGVWTITLTGLLALILACRARVFPLVPQTISLLLGSAALCCVLCRVWTKVVPESAQWMVGPLLLGACVLSSMFVVDFPGHVRARLRGFVDLVETGAALGVIPAAVGVLGTYRDLLESF